MTIDSQKYLNEYNEQLTNLPTHYLEDGEPETQIVTWYYSFSESKWKYRASDAPVYIDITHNGQEYKLIYNSSTTDSVENMPQNESVISGQSSYAFVVSPKKPTRRLYVFAGWQDESGILVNAGERITATKTSPTRTLKAVWKDDENGNGVPDDEETEYVEVTFRISGGKWRDGSTSDIKETVRLLAGVGTLAADKVPSGMTPNDGFTGGAWDVEPNTSAGGIAGNVTYTYSFKRIAPVETRATVNFKVVNGTWVDGTDKDIIETVTLLDGVGTLEIERVPVGMRPNAGFTGGKWDIEPNTKKDGITGDAIYTYSFERIMPVEAHATVTFKVVNGTWADGTDKDISVMVTLLDGVGTLETERVPVGMRPNAGFTGGKWDTEPNTTKNGITGDVTYIYTYRKIVPVETQATITFKVEGGAWENGTADDIVVTITLLDGMGTLSENSVPVGMKPLAGYGEGAWVETPDTQQNAIKNDVTYIFRFKELKTTALPQTGDNSHVEILFGVMLLSLCGIIFVMMRKEKGKPENKN